jgi:uncharacterized protein (DUF1697 family)
MATYVTFLRAINLGRNRKVPMKDLVPCLEAVGFEDVATHLATGNVRLVSRLRSTSSVEAAVEEALEARFGFEVPTVALTLEELAGVVAEAGDVPEALRQYVTLLKKTPPADVVHELDSWSAPGEGAKVGRRAVHWWADHDSQASTLSNAVVEKQLGVATTRTVAVVRTVHQKWGTDD